MKLYGLFVINAAATAENLVEKDPRHHTWVSQTWTSFTDALSDLFTGFTEVTEVGLEALFLYKIIQDVLSQHCTTVTVV